MKHPYCPPIYQFTLENILITLLVYLFVFSLPVVAADAIKVTQDSVKINDETDFPVYRYKGKGKAVLVWLPSEAGILDQEKKVAQQLADSGIDVWLLDLHTAYFLPRVRKSLDAFKAAHIATALDKIARRTNKPVYVIANSRGALVALRGVRAWQENAMTASAAPASYTTAFKGLVLISAQLYEKTPSPGEDGVFDPIVTHTNLPILWIQPDKSPWYWKMHRSVKALQSKGSDVLTWVVAGVRDRYYYRPDSTSTEDKTAKQLPRLIRQSLTLVSRYASKERRAVSMTVAKAAHKPQLRGLAPFKGNPVPPELVLPNLKGGSLGLPQLKNKLVLVNFWATWCPPCVHEMPSMQRLQDKYEKRGFTILAVNMAEKPETIKQFLQTKVSVKFPIVLDADGKALSRWKVYAFPTSFLLDRKGKIRYAVFGSIDWDTPSIHKIVEKLLNE